MITLEAYRAKIGSFCSRRHTCKTKHDLFYRNINVSNNNATCFLRTFGFSIFILIVVLNLNFACLKFLILLQHGDIESNPGPTFKTLKVIQGSFHQGHPKFGETAGIQCACNSLFSLCWSVVKRVTLWSMWDMDHILENGDILYKSLNTHTALNIDELPEYVNVENSSLRVTLLSQKSGTISMTARNDFLHESYEQTSNTGTGLIFFISGYTFAIIWSKQAFFLFDSHSRSTEGFTVSDGYSVLMKFKSLDDVQNYIREAYLYRQQINSVYYQIQYVDIDTAALDVTQTLKTIRNLKERSRKRKNTDTVEHSKRKEQKKKYAKTQHSKIVGTPEHQLRKEQMRKDYSKIIGTPEHEKRKENMRKRDHCKRRKSDFTKNIKHFAQEIQKRPYFICIVCNRCLSVLIFQQSKYNLTNTAYVTHVCSYDGSQYICKTCDGKLKKKKEKIPCQAVCNKLQIFEFPVEFSSLNKLEKVIISKRILLIMPKGQFSKVKGAVCNVPVESDSMCNILPRGSDNNGLVLLKLKRKLSYHGHVLFEPARPDVVKSVLCYLKENNFLYKNIVINIDNIPVDLLSLDEIPIVTENEACLETAAIDEVENPLDQYRVSANESILIPVIPCQANEESITMAPGEGKKNHCLC